MLIYICPRPSRGGGGGGGEGRGGGGLRGDFKRELSGERSGAGAWRGGGGCHARGEGGEGGSGGEEVRRLREELQEAWLRVQVAPGLNLDMRWQTKARTKLLYAVAEVYVCSCQRM
jgi:hypothetical protein